MTNRLEQVVLIKSVLFFLSTPVAAYERWAEITDLSVFYSEAVSVCLCVLFYFNVAHYKTAAYHWKWYSSQLPSK